MIQILLLLRVATAGASGTSLPCDIYGAAGTPCVAAHSVARALYASYTGPLYSVQRSSDNAEKDIGVVSAGGIVDTAAVALFCPQSTEQCTVQRIYDQSPKGNHLATGIKGITAVNATRQQFMIGAGGNGKLFYAAVFEGGMGYRNDTAAGLATGDHPETIFMVVAGKHYNNQCCFDYGGHSFLGCNSAAVLEAVYFGNASGGSMNHGGAGSGPWVQADLEKGLWSGNTTDTKEPPLVADVVTAMLKGRANWWALKGGDAGLSNGRLATFYEGVRPSPKTAGHSLPGGGNYNPMKKQGAIILGVGGDNSRGGVGTFFEGAITSGYATDAADAAVHASIIAANYQVV